MKDLKRYAQEEFDQFEDRYKTTFFNSLSGFKSLNLVGTQNAQGLNNLTLMNSIFHVGAKPPYLGMIFRPHTVPRHGLENIKAVKRYTLNQVHPSFIQKAHQTTARYPREESEFAAVGLTPQDAGFGAPYVHESFVKLGLELEEIQEIKCNGTLMVIGSVKEVWLPETLVQKDGFVALHEAETMTCAGLDAYFSVEPVVRLNYAKPDLTPAELPFTDNATTSVG